MSGELNEKDAVKETPTSAGNNATSGAQAAQEQAVLLVIRPHSKRNGITLAFVSGLLFCTALCIFLFAKVYFGIGLVMFALGAVGLVLGYAKLSQPPESIVADSDGLGYFHRRGSYRVSWDNIQRIDVPRVSQGLGSLDLPFIGIKLKKINPLLDSISPRLATGLLSEQRPLMMTAAAQTDIENALEQQLGAEFTPLVTHGERYRGVLAMFGHRCLLLERELGFHLFIPADALDDEPVAVARQLRQLKTEIDTARLMASAETAESS
ncbi:DUF2982 domain-containing protein [Shewanella sp. JM162201]|uniref:DUF2982 domain-containing protein n=1 Tax=Shewanella jiangmenensis TaxID=2837387 RepID=A0ABS5UZB0_9GAMM|nr:DUF2982 domain-containing protein [Shewanella jiangmenensis]MBT1442973.1 DUF2982 domain-containing protein [Shewanella jiangmenensis]